MINVWTSYNENKYANHWLIVIQIKNEEKRPRYKYKQVGF